jgi:hypothetical protein
MFGTYPLGSHPLLHVEREPFPAADEDHLAHTQVQPPVPYARLVVGSLLFPFVASGLGNALFSSLSRKAFDRTMLGGKAVQPLISEQS